MRRIAYWLVLLILVFSCGGEAGPRSAGIVSTRITHIESGDFGSIAWLKDGSLVVTYEPDPEDETERLWRFRIDRKGLEKLPLGNDPKCRQTLYQRPTSLPDGRLGYVRHCSAFEFDEGLIGTNAYYAYDSQSDVVEKLAPLGPADGRRRFGTTLQQDSNPAVVSWNPGLSQAIISVDAICSTLGLLTRDGVREITGPRGAGGVVEDEGVWWSLGRVLMQRPSESCADSGRALAPAWSPDGDTVAFLASPKSKGIEGPARLGAPSNLYFMEPGQWKPRRVLSDINADIISSVQWSPDGSWLLITAGLKGGRRGLWLFHPQRETLQRISSRAIYHAAWSPDGGRIAGFVNATPDDFEDAPQNELWTFDVTKVVSAP